MIHDLLAQGCTQPITLRRIQRIAQVHDLGRNAISRGIVRIEGRDDGLVALEDARPELAMRDDEQLVEGYSHFTKRELKKFLAFVEEIVADCSQMVQTAKANRAPRKRKAVPLSKQVAKMKYMKEFAELKLKSCKAEDIIGSTELWVYNTKYRKVQVYKAESSLAVKGTTIIGFDIKESKSMTLRKPEEFFKGLSMGKRALNGAIKKLTTKPTTPNGRINEECVLLGAF